MRRDEPSSAGAEPVVPRLPPAGDASAAAAERRREVLAAAEISTTELSGRGQGIAPEQLEKSVEGFIGFAQVPVGVFGPLVIRGAHAEGAFYVPIATSEGALVHSYQHVSNLLARADGVEARCSDSGVLRSPAFAFADLASAASFAAWVPSQTDAIAALVAENSRHCRLQSLRPALVGDAVFVQFTYSTGDAAGQNMVTAATQAACRLLLEHAPVAPQYWQLEANWSGDKKATSLALQRVRGRRASARAVFPDKLCRRYFRASAVAILDVWELAVAGSVLSGAIGDQANVANALAGLFIACGQDVACVSEAYAGVTRARITPAGDLALSVTLPNLIVGTVGGGTYLPTARECLAMLRCSGAGHGDKLAEICAAVALCGEAAVFGAMAGGSFAEAHAALKDKRGG